MTVRTLPKTWEEFCETHPVEMGEAYIVPYNSKIETMEGCAIRDPQASAFWLPSKRYAEAMLALCQLLQLRNCYNEDWRPDWSNGTQAKHIIYCIDNKITRMSSLNVSFVLAFKTAELRDEFLENFRDLIEVAKPLL